MAARAPSIDSVADRPGRLLMADVDEAQWIAWYRSLEKPLYNVAYRWLWDAAESQDVVQDAFLRCWRIRDRIEADTFKALIFRTTMRLASNRIRRRKLWRFVSFAAEESDAPEPGDDDVLVARALQQALAAMPESLRRVLILNELGGLSYKEIAEVMSIREGTVGSRRHRAMAALRERLEAMGVRRDEC